jgi:hypothetical protein
LAYRLLDSFAGEKNRSYVSNRDTVLVQNGAESCEMFHTDYRTLIDRGRKAGLSTAEMYSAIAARPPAGGEPAARQADGNGFVPRYTEEGRRVFHPACLHIAPGEEKDPHQGHHATRHG